MHFVGIIDKYGTEKIHNDLDVLILQIVQNTLASYIAMLYCFGCTNFYRKKPVKVVKAIQIHIES